jgi:hypothetical protein
MEKVVYGNVYYIFAPIRRRKRSCILFQILENAMTSDWSAQALTANVVISNCQNLKNVKIWSASLMRILSVDLSHDIECEEYHLRCGAV